MKSLNEKQLLVARQEFTSFMSLKGAELSKLKLKTPAAFFKQKMNTTYEALGCVGYHAASKSLTATIHIKRAIGYSGGSVEGTYEYVRFYLDYQDGDGWEDMGVVGVNVNDIPTQKDCSDAPEKPIDYVVELMIEPKRKFCSVPNLPLVRAVLSWNTIPEDNDPELTKGTYVWSDKKDVQIQIEPRKFFFPDFPLFELDDILSKAIFNPSLSLNQIAQIKPQYSDIIKKAQFKMAPKSLSFSELVKHYKKEKVAPQRFGYSFLKQASNSPFLSNFKDLSSLFEINNISIAEVLAQLNKLKCNTEYEELICVGADYHREALVGTIKIKKSSGYSGGLCSAGSKEFVSFWVQNDDDCEWTHAGTTTVNVYDIQNVPEDGLFYSAVLPYSFSGLKKDQPKAQILKVRAVLSWSVAPTGMDCVNFGNVVESYIPIQPKTDWSGVGPKLKYVGGISVEKINPSTGLTMANARFDYNALPAKENSGFSGVIVVKGLTNEFEGLKYKIKITNLNTSEEQYITKRFLLDNDLFSTVDDEGYFTYYGDSSNNSNNILARFSPGTDDKLRITIEHPDDTSYSTVIQMNSTRPKALLTINNYGECSHFVKGMEISGSFEVAVAFLDYYVLTTTITDANVFEIERGETSKIGEFSVTSSETKNCGSITLKAVPRTIVNSVAMHTGVHDSEIICLKDA